ncbi:MAG TPA: DNA ligase B, partial [Rhodanobacter sp.]
RWLQALGVPASVADGLPDWAALSARGASDWQALAGIGAGRANQLVAFFGCPEVRVQAARLHAAGVQGF